MALVREVHEIAGFFGPYRFLSNFYPAPVEFGGVLYPTSEHAYQASKTTSQHWRTRILRDKNPAAAKRLGRQAPLRKDWETIKINTMHQILRIKFQHPNLHQWLLATANAELLELNTHGDQYWGVIQVGGRRIGHNHLGKLLMVVRSELRQQA